MCVTIMGVGAGPAGPILAGPLFGDLMKFTIDMFNNCMRTLRTPITARPLQKSFLHPWLSINYEQNHARSANFNVAVLHAVPFATL